MNRFSATNGDCCGVDLGTFVPSPLVPARLLIKSDAASGLARRAAKLESRSSGFILASICGNKLAAFARGLSVNSGVAFSS